MALGFNNNLGNQGANFNCHPSNIVVNCISIYIMVILDNSRTLGAFERQSGILHTNDQFDENLPELINAGNRFISLYINTDDCLIEFSTEQPDSSDNLCEDLSLTTDGITFLVYFD